MSTPTSSNDDRVRQLERSLALRDQMLDLAGHDLRNPLHSLSIALGELDNADLPQAERRQFAGAARRALERMERILNDFLDLGHLDSGTMSITTQPVSIAWLVEQLRSEHAAACEAAGVPLTISGATDGSVLVDPDRAKQAFTKLLTNACRHARGSGGVELSVRRAGERVELVVADRGPGFGEHVLPDPFERSVDPARSRRTRGMGLPLAQGLVIAMGGRISARNRPETGAEVTVSLRSA